MLMMESKSWESLVPVVNFDIEDISEGGEVIELKQLLKFISKGKILYLVT